MRAISLTPLADAPELGDKPLGWSLELWGETNPWFSAEDWQAFYERGAQAEFSRWDLAGRDQELIYLAMDGAQVVGAIALVDFDDLADFRHLKPWVAAFVVDPTKRGSGIGSQMLAALEKQARVFGIRELHLWTEDQRNFYRNRGYELLEHRDYPQIAIDVMRKSL